ncbi:helix-turn-helix domain-containing protein [Streptomyces sp. NPDC002962]|uniref:helix-turn-helix domain-containing protein n=1 Tax=Streptomyces sp. NPDC002962 TaxID=3364674 RepID=UPI00369ED8E3
MPDADPIYLRRRLSAQLQAARKNAGYSQPEVANEMVWSLSKVMRLESGRTKISITDLRALIGFYGIHDATAAELLAHAQEARRQPWWQEYRGVLSEGFKSYLGYEASASIVRNFEILFIPGLLQTEEYARAILTQSLVPEKEELLELRMRRQERLLQTSSGTELHFLIDEAALRRVVGNATVMRAQLEHLQEIAQLPHVRIGMIPYEAGLYPLLRSAYVIFEFPSSEQDRIVYLENPDGSVILHDKATVDVQRTVEDYLEAFWEVENEYARPVNEVAGST